jgi:hypothetical protein
VEQSIYITQNTNYYIYLTTTNYLIQTTILITNDCGSIYIQKSSSSSLSLPSGSEHTWLEGILRERDSDSVEEEGSSSLKRRLRPHLAINFSSKVSSWFIDDSFEETSSSICASASVSSSNSPKELSSPSSSKNGSLFFMVAENSVSSFALHLLLSLEAIV